MSTYIRRQEVVHAIGAQGQFTLRVTDADVRLTGAHTDRAEVVASFEINASSDDEASRVFESVQLRVSQGAGELTLEQREETTPHRNPIIRIFDRSEGVTFSVEATIPRRATLRLETVSGDVNATGLHGEQRYASVSGDLFLVEGSGQVRLNTVSGDALLRANGSLTLRAESISGDLGVSAGRLDGLRLSTVSGDADVEGALQADGEYRVETVSGDVTVGPVGPATFEVRGLSTDISSDLDHRIEGRADRRRVTVDGGGPELLFSSMSGDFRVRRPGEAHGARSAEEAPAADAAGAAHELEVLRALERGEIDVDEAARRLTGP